MMKKPRAHRVLAFPLPTTKTHIHGHSGRTGCCTAPAPQDRNSPGVTPPAAAAATAPEGMDSRSVEESATSRRVCRATLSYTLQIREKQQAERALPLFFRKGNPPSCAPLKRQKKQSQESQRLEIARDHDGTPENCRSSSIRPHAVSRPGVMVRCGTWLVNRAANAPFPVDMRKVMVASLDHESAAAADSKPGRARGRKLRPHRMFKKCSFSAAIPARGDI